MLSRLHYTIWRSCEKKKMSSKRDVESGERTLYPTMLESPELRWSFIRKVYSIITFQLLLTVAVASVVVFVPPIPRFFVSTTPGLVLYIVLIFIPLISTSSLLFILFIHYHMYNLLLTILFRSNTIRGLHN